MTSIPVLPGIGDLARNYDGFILDLWGVVHDGVEAYPTAKDTLEQMKAEGKKTLLLSNAPRRSYVLIELMEKMGLPRNLYGEVFSSGEAVNMELQAKSDPFFAALGPTAYMMGPERDYNVVEETAFTLTDDIAKADWILNTGPVDFSQTLADFEAVLVEGAERSLPMVCANPDHLVIRQGQEVLCAGAMAARFEDLGGRVALRGKPDPAVYDLSLQRLGLPKEKVMVVGDAMETDVLGGTQAGLDVCFCTGGIHAKGLGVTHGEMADPAKVAALADDFGLRPIAAIPAFVWA